jgi:hypothetical protein
MLSTELTAPGQPQGNPVHDAPRNAAERPQLVPNPAFASTRRAWRIGSV